MLHLPRLHGGQAKRGASRGEGQGQGGHTYSGMLDAPQVPARVWGARAPWCEEGKQGRKRCLQNIHAHLSALSLACFQPSQAAEATLCWDAACYLPNASHRHPQWPPSNMPRLTPTPQSGPTQAQPSTHTPLIRISVPTEQTRMSGVNSGTSACTTTNRWHGRTRVQEV